MKAAVLPLVCVCACLWNHGVKGARAAESDASVPARTSATARYGYDPQEQSEKILIGLPPVAGSASSAASRTSSVLRTNGSTAAAKQNTPHRAGLPPIRTRYANPAGESPAGDRSAVSIQRPWETPDLPAERDRYSSSRIAPTNSTPEEPSHVRTAELYSPTNPTTNEASHEAWYSNSLRSHSPAPASKLVSPASPPRPAPRPGRTLMGGESEYGERDGHTFAVDENVMGGGRPKPRGNSATLKLSVPKTFPTQPPYSREQTTPQALPRSAEPQAIPAGHGAAVQRTAPARWFRQNPLRDSGELAQTATQSPGMLASDGYVQQTSANFAAQPPAENVRGEPVPSIGEELPLPFDPNMAERDAKSAPGSKPAPPSTEKNNLSLDDFPFDVPNGANPSDTKPAEPKAELPASPFPADTPTNKPAPGEQPLPSPADSFPFSPDDSPAGRTGELEIPADAPADSPTEEAPIVEEEFFGSSPLDTPPAQPAPREREELKSIRSITASIAPPAGELPANRNELELDEEAIRYGFGNASRGWAVSNYQWEATAMKHQPLYFEEVNLERYGYSRGVLQPAVSYGQFLVNVIAMPYKSIAEPSREAVYTLGQYRPGSYAPYRVQYPPFSAAGGMFEAGVILGLVFVIP